MAACKDLTFKRKVICNFSKAFDLLERQQKSPCYDETSSFPEYMTLCVIYCSVETDVLKTNFGASNNVRDYSTPDIHAYTKFINGFVWDTSKHRLLDKATNSIFEIIKTQDVDLEQRYTLLKIVSLGGFAKNANK